MMKILFFFFPIEGVGNDPREDRYFSIPKQVSNFLILVIRHSDEEEIEKCVLLWVCSGTEL